ncbi:sensor histidine kinase [Streptomyces griseorubiginosus]|uniref:sensor histidine kinase n=1 Tax=Streptomyces griseorubiginosus TaxID=67304 RepID=UPI003656A5EA
MPVPRLAVHRSAGFARCLPHLVFLVAAGGTLVRLVQLNHELCWRVAPPTAAMAVLYAAGLARWDRLGRARTLLLGVLLLLWTSVVLSLTGALASGYAWLAVPFAVLAMRMPTRAERAVTLAVITALLPALLVRAYGGFDPEVLAPPVAAVWATVLLYRDQQRLIRELSDTRGELARQQREAGRLAERARIARDLHDTLAQEIAGSRMLLQAADRDWERRPEAARRQVQVVTEALGEHLAQTRGIIQDLTPPVLAKDGLESALRDLCARTDATAGTPRVTFRTEHAACPLPTERAVALLRITQGLLANACEHAHAGEVQVALVYGRQGAVAVEVHDDGTGFDPAAVQTGEKDRGFGLGAARERLVALGGSLTVDSAPGRGTRVRASLREAAGAQDKVPVGAR